MMDNTELSPGAREPDEPRSEPLSSQPLSSQPIAREEGEETGFERTVKRDSRGLSGKPSSSTSRGANPLDEPPPEIPDVEILGVLGRGGQGVVYRGRQTYLERDVAVKVLPWSADQDFEQRFRREARILAGLADPHIVACHQAGATSDGRCYLVMELIDGPDLARWMEQHGKLAVRDALVLTRDVARGLEHAHSVGIIHRDVKPQNVLLQPAPGASERFPFRAKLADLGLARGGPGELAVTQLTAPGSMMGTPSTMAPEQFEDAAKVDFRADVYGLGCVLFHALVGECAYRDKTLGPLVRRKTTGSTPDPARENPQVPAGVAKLVRRMLATAPDERPASYAQLIDAIDAEIEALDRPPLRERVAPAARPAFVIALVFALIGAIVWWPRDDEPDGAGESRASVAPPAIGPNETGSEEPELAPPDAPTQVQPPEPSFALAAGEVWRPFEAWSSLEELLAVDGWTRTQPEGRAVWGCVEGDLAAVLANSPSAPSTATRTLPEGTWTLRGRLGASRSFGWDDATPRAGVRILFAGDAAFEWECAPDRGEPRVSWRWTTRSADGWRVEDARPSGSRELADAEATFELRRTPAQVELLLLGERAQPVELSAAATSGAPQSFELFVEGGMGRWSDFTFTGE